MIGCVARFEPQKDHPTLFAALSILAQRGQAFTCVLVGRGCEPDNSTLTRLARQYGIEDRLLLLGAVTEVETVYQYLDVVVLSAAYGESMPLVLLEALASGRPIVATDVGGTRSMLGKHGDLVPARSPRLLADALVQTLRERDHDPSAAIVRHNYVAQRFDILTVAQAWMGEVLNVGSENKAACKPNQSHR
jgi:glycosyltransferase involved in cell wall biosynthesis